MTRHLISELLEWKNLQAKSLRFFCEKFSVAKALRFSLGDYNEGGYPFGTKLIDVPLFAV